MALNVLHQHKQYDDIDAPDAMGLTALYWAVSRGNVECVRLLLSYNADQDKVNNSGVSVFNVALERGNEVIIGLLKAEAHEDPISGCTMM